MRKILLVVLAIGGANAFAVSQEIEREPIVKYETGHVWLTGQAADDLWAALAVDTEVKSDETLVKKVPGVTCTFPASQNTITCDVEVKVSAK